MNPSIDFLDVVALTEDLPTGLIAGQVGTVVEKLADGVFEVGCCYQGRMARSQVDLSISNGIPNTVVGTVRRRAAPANRPPKRVSPPNTDAPAVRPYRNNQVANDWAAANSAYFRAI